MIILNIFEVVQYLSSTCLASVPRMMLALPSGIYNQGI